jgi:cytochrome c oxidase subunit 2
VSATPTPPTRPEDDAHHGRRVIAAWLVLSAIATPLVAIFVGPEIPPGNATVQGQGQVFDNQVMTSLVTPILCLLAVFFAYGLVTFHARRGEGLVDGPPLRNDARVQVTWIVSTTAMVLFLAGFGTYELLKDGSGGGQGPNPIASPSGSDPFQVQVIAQQWEFTYRYPSLGGLESADLVLPANTDVELHVTSLDAVHSFWAVELGVKADANPGIDNVAYVQTRGPRTFHVRCAELCGLFHGYMFNNGEVVDAATFHTWAATEKRIFASIAKYMPTYSKTYLPDPQRRAG